MAVKICLQFRVFTTVWHVFKSNFLFRNSSVSVCVGMMSPLWRVIMPLIIGLLWSSESFWNVSPVVAAVESACLLVTDIKTCVCLFVVPPADGSEIPSWVEQNGGVLHFSKVARADAGNYTCMASNSLQGEIRAVVQLTVAGSVVHFAKAHYRCSEKLNYSLYHPIWH